MAIGKRRILSFVIFLKMQNFNAKDINDAEIHFISILNKGTIIALTADNPIGYINL